MYPTLTLRKKTRINKSYRTIPNHFLMNLEALVFSLVQKYRYIVIVII